METFAKITKFLNKFNQSNQLSATRPADISKTHISKSRYHRINSMSLEEEREFKSELPALTKILLECFIKLSLIGSESTDSYLNNERLYELLNAVFSRYYVER